MEFKGTKGRLEPKFVNGICIGIGTIGEYSQITANSVLGHIDTDEQYSREKEEIESNMLLYSKSYELLEFMFELKSKYESDGHLLNVNAGKINQLIKKATEL